MEPQYKTDKCGAVLVEGGVQGPKPHSHHPPAAPQRTDMKTTQPVQLCYFKDDKTESQRSYVTCPRLGQELGQGGAGIWSPESPASIVIGHFCHICVPHFNITDQPESVKVKQTWYKDILMRESSRLKK